MIQARRRISQITTVLISSPYTAARSQHVSQILSQAFIDPEQRADHRLLIIRGRKSRRPAVLSIPRVCELMWKEIAGKQIRVVVEKVPRLNAVVARLMMLQP